MPTPDAIAQLLATPPDLPVVPALARLRGLLRPTPGTGAGPTVVLTAPPGTGKTTLVPPLVADVLREQHPGPPSQRVVVTQPRRIAARAAARHLASLLGEPVGQAVGYAVRGERRGGADTRVEVVTAGLLLRRLQADPALEGVGAVVLDEVHERALDTDLLVALLLDARAGLREDLTVVAMSATLDAQRLRRLLGPGAEGDLAPLVEVSGRAHPVAERWAPPPTGVTRLGPGGVPREFLAHVARTVVGVLDEPEHQEADVLVFVPGAREVDEVVSRVRASLRTQDQARAGAQVDVLPLHGRLPADAQDKALSPSAPGRRRVVVSTSVAQSSLTVPGVRVVVDSTLSREPRLDVARGISGLVTVGVSQADGVQRGGRAGRQGPGTVLRCCSPVDWAQAASAPTPEILTADLTRAALELAAWGTPGGQGLAWLDPPPAAAMAAASTTLSALGLAQDDGTVTPLGQAVAAVPAEVRTARALLLAAPLLGTRLSAQAAALLSSGLRAPGGDLTALARQVGGGEPTWRAEAKRLERAAREHAPQAAPALTGGGGQKFLPLGQAVGLVAAMARPEWIARRRGPVPGAGQEAHYLTVAGVGARLPAGSALAGSEWLAVAELDRAPGSSGRSADALVRAAAPLEEQEALELAAPWLRQQERTFWQEGRLRSERLRRLGAITLASCPGPTPSPVQVAQAVLDACRQEAQAGRPALGLLPWGREASALRARLALLRRELGEPWPDVSEAALLERAETWLAPAVADLAQRLGGRRFDLGRLDTAGALRALLPWPQAARLDELVPERVQVPSGSLVAVAYVDEQGQALERPVLAARVQECFGWTRSPRLVDGRVVVVLHLLSPARRAVAVTDDLGSFWQGPYQQVRAEMRGRYPKHSWPQDPTTAPPLRGTRHPRR